jgi:4'-phosphopantetheinyl transferase
VQPIAVAATTSEVLAAVPDADRLLTDEERSRVAAFHFRNDRDDFVAAHVLARASAAALLGVPIGRLTWRQRCPACGGPHGRPSIGEAPDLGVSLAHAHGYVAAAVAPGPIGVDVEPIRPGCADRRLARMVLTEGEADALDSAADPDAAFLRQWVRREALIKVGAATLDTVPAVDMSDLPTGEPAGGWAAHRWGGFVLTDWRLGAALGAVAAHEPVRPRLWEVGRLIRTCRG